MEYTYKIIKQLLFNNPALRDNDNALIVAIWKSETAPFLNSTFYNRLEGGMLTKSCTITRLRRKAQEQYIGLRGVKYNARMAKQAKVINDLRKL